MVSLVVPGISETIARSSFKMALSKVDFPTFGWPIIATGIPFFNTLPMEKELINEPTSDTQNPKKFVELFPVGKFNIFFTEVKFKFNE